MMRNFRQEKQSNRSKLAAALRGGLSGALVATLALGQAGPAFAQFFIFETRPPAPIGRQQQQQQQQSPRDWLFNRDRTPRQSERAVDSSRAPAPKKSDVQPERNILVLGDAMADWLAYGLEDAFSETPEIGVTRKHKTVSGLIQYERKNGPADWAAAAKAVLPSEKADVIVIMLGLHDRRDIAEPVVEKADKKPGKKDDTKKDETKKDDTKKDAAQTESKPAASSEETKKASRADDEEDDGPDSIVAPEPGAKKGGMHDFKTEKWIELYKKKIAEMIASARTRNVPVIWVGLPSVRGTRSTSDMLFLDSLYREEASKAGITYVDVWDGFVDDGGRFTNYGPDFEGQTRRLRANDGVFFTRAGARKLAHFVEREIRRIFASRAVPVALPSDPGQPDLSVKPGGPAARPLAGPIVPLIASSVGSDQLLGGAGTRPAAIDALAARTLVKGESPAAPAGRSDDFAWPRRAIGEMQSVPTPEPPPEARASATSGEASARTSAAGVPGGTLRPPAGNAATRPQAPPPPPRRSFFETLFGR